MEDILIGTTDRTIPIFILDPAQTDGSGKTGLAHTDITVTYTRYETDNDVVLTDVTGSLSALANLTAAHSDWGWFEVGGGEYRLDVADALFASGAWYTVLKVSITSSAAAATPKAFRLVAYNALDGVRLGLTALPNAAAEAAGGIYTRGSGAGQINQNANGRIDVNIKGVNGDDFDAGIAQFGVNVISAGGTAWGSGAITANSIANDAITAAKIANGAIDAATFAADVDAEFLSYIVDDATRIDASALNTATGTTIPAILDDTDLIDDGTSGLAKIATDVAAILVDTGTTLDGRIPAALVGGRMDATVDATGMETGAIDAILTRAMTESYAADGATVTVAQALYMIYAMLAEASASGTTLTIKKLDGSTTAMTFTLNDASTPTSITRSG